MGALEGQLEFVDSLKPDITSYLATETVCPSAQLGHLNLANWLTSKRLLCYFRPDEEQGQLWRKARDGWIEKAPDDGSADAPTAPGPRWRSVFGAPPSPGSLLWPGRPTSLEMDRAMGRADPVEVALSAPQNEDSGSDSARSADFKEKGSRRRRSAQQGVALRFLSSKGPAGSNWIRRQSWDQLLSSGGREDMKSPKEISPSLVPPDLADSLLEFTSCFESGNLRCVLYDKEGDEYFLFLDNDLNSRGHTQWFYFAVRNGRAGRVYRIRIVNMSKPKALFRVGMRRFLSTSTSTLSFDYVFERGHDSVFFAYYVTLVPYTYSMLRWTLNHLVRDPATRAFCRLKRLAMTVGEACCDMLTITNSRIERKMKKVVVVSARVHPGESNASWLVHGLMGFLLSSTAEAQERKVMETSMLQSSVHGQSWCNGASIALLELTPRVSEQVLRDNFVWICVPMLNPDGVICPSPRYLSFGSEAGKGGICNISGNYRCGLCGTDLNRQWKQPDKILHSSVHKLKKLVARSKAKLCMYLDLHGHSRKCGIFAYACGQFAEDDHRRFTVRIFPKLLSMLTPEFNFFHCICSRFRAMNLGELKEIFESAGLPLVSSTSSTGTVTGSASTESPGSSGSDAVDTAEHAEHAEQISQIEQVQLVLSQKSEALAKSMWRPLRTTGDQISVVSFNMLLKGFDQKPYYPNIPAALRSWQWRKQQLQHLICGIDADVYCKPAANPSMQEVECSTFAEEFSFLAQNGYSAVAPKDDSKGKIPELAKCAIFFKMEKLQHIWHEHRSRVVLCALKHQRGQVIYFASCHLEGAPSEGRTRLTQLRKALQSIRKHQEQSGFDASRCAMVFTGDFNEDESGPVARSLALKPGDREAEAAEACEFELVDHGLHLADLYDPKTGPFSLRPPTFGAPTSGKTKLRAIDFMFYTCKTLTPVAVRAPFTPEQEEATLERSIPAEWHFSDHVPLGAVFQVGKGKRGTGRVVAAKDCVFDGWFGTDWNRLEQTGSCCEDLGITNAYTIEASMWGAVDVMPASKAGEPDIEEAEPEWTRMPVVVAFTASKLQVFGANLARALIVQHSLGPMVQGRLRCSRAWDGGKGGPWPVLTAEKERTPIATKCLPCGSQVWGVTPQVMWLGGAIDRGRWYKHRFKEGQLIEGPVRDNDGKAQGFVLVRVLAHESTASDGHLFAAEFVAASDSHYRWWMTEGEGHKIAKKGLYHACEGSAVDCTFTKGRNVLVHLEKFRVIGPKEWASKVEDSEEEQESSPESEGSEEGKIDLKIQKMKDALKKLEKQKRKTQTHKKSKGEATDLPVKKKKKPDKPKDSGRLKPRKRSPSSEESKEGRKKKKATPRSSDSEEAAKKKKKASTGSKAKKKRAQDASSSEEEQGVGLFEKGPKDEGVPDPIPKKGDRGPFGPGMPVEYQGDETSDSEGESPCRAAPAQSVKSGQQALITYSHRKPGRLASRLLLKMRSEVALGSAGAVESSQDRTPPIAVNYLLTLMMPHLGSKMNLRTQRELRTLMVVLDLLAKKAPARAADIVAQRVKALERATAEGHWATAQFLELIPTENAGLLDRDEEVYLSGDESHPARPQQRRSRSRRSQGRERQRQNRRSRSRRKRKDKEEGHRCSIEPEKAAADQGEANPTRSTWRESLKLFMKEGRPVLDVFARVWALLDSIPSPLGTYAKSCKSSRVPPDLQGQSQRGNDLLPLDPGVMDRFVSVPETIRDSMKLVLLILNFLSMGGRYNEKRDVPAPKTLSSGQEKMLSHIKERATDLASEPKLCPPVSQAELVLGKAKFDYAGEPIMVMEDLEASKVIPVWPKVGEAAVQPVMKFLPPELAEMIEDPKNCLLPSWEWPSKPTQSKVRATQEEWNKIVQAGYERGLMVPLQDDQVFRDVSGRKVLNGAGAVKKLKEVGGEQKTLQRFISNFIPSNQFQTHLSGGDRFLPYLGQLTLLGMEDGETFLVDSEDFCSCFNLFTLPSSWHCMMAFEKTVDGKIMGATPGQQVFPAMCVVPMGWINAVTVIQSVVRTLVFAGADIPESSEVSKIKQMPETDDLSIIYLDSFDELRKLSSQCAEVLEGKPSARHLKFQEVCKDLGLPLNEAKRLVGATRGTLQGGLLDGQKGWYKLAPDKQLDLVSLSAGMLTMPQWREFELRHLIGKATFRMCFRRPLLSIFQAVFGDVQRLMKAEKLPPSADALDELIMVLGMVPFMGTSLRVALDHEITCSDASETGGGVAVSAEFMPEAQTVEHDGGECWWCDRPFRSEQRYPCPSQCGAVFCSLECIWAHRKDAERSQRGCLRKTWGLPKFGERFSGPHAPLSHAVAQMGHIEVQPPFDVLRGSDYFSDEGKAELNTLLEDPFLYAEHWAPECKLFSRARGKKIRLRSGRVLDGPQPVRDAAHVMGFPWLKSQMKARLRKSNAMALRALKRGEKVAQSGMPRHWTSEHPKNSWLWEFALVKKLEDMGMQHAIGSSCCFGGARQKFYSFFGSSEEIRQRLTRHCQGHPNLLTYEVEELADCRLYFPTEEESEYPWALCLAYARGLRAQADKEKVFEQVYQQSRELWYQDELADPTVAKPVATYLTRWEAEMRAGLEEQHLRNLLQRASMRGTDIRIHLSLGSEEEQHEVPYPAMRWKWKTVASFPWAQTAHINELELHAVVVTSKHRARNVQKFHTRWLHVVDSTVSRGALSKGRSSSGTSVTRPLDVMGRPKSHLKYAGLQPNTLRAYRQALDRFATFAGQRSLTSIRPSHLDQLLSEYINEAYQKGEPLTYSGHLLSAVKRFHPQLRLKLPIASQYLRNWTRSHVPQRALPASWELVEAMLAVALCKSEDRLAFLLGISFHAMLRTAEMMALTVSHILIHPAATTISVVIPTAKTSQGNPQVLQIRDPILVDMAIAISKRHKKTAFLWKGGTPAFRQRFQRLLKTLGFSYNAYLPYSLRRGGATWYYQTTLSLDATMTRGRWACQKTCRIYVDTGTAQLAHLSWSPKQVKAVNQWRLKGARLRLRQCQKGSEAD
eukprot:s206_g34.t1